LRATADPPYRPGMDRRFFLLTALAGVIGAPVGGGAQADRVKRVGLLLGFRPPPEWIAGGFFFGQMRELGWVDGQNVVFEQRAANERLELLPMLARELIASKVDVIVAAPSTALRAAKEATATIPIVFVLVSQPVRRGFVASLTRPGGNITGLADVTLELMPKRLELLKELVPGATRVAVLVVPGLLPPDVIQGVLDDSKRASRLRLETFEVRTSEDFDAVFASIRQSRAEGLTLIPDALFFHQRAQIADLAIKHRLPIVADERSQAEAGALLSYDGDLRQMYRQVAMYVDRILRGAKPADLPVQEPATFELIINLKTAKALGLTIPPSLLARADQIIE
jgi:putative tryptophan/tyrosine transport system substrate-binding protein